MPRRGRERLGGYCGAPIQSTCLLARVDVVITLPARVFMPGADDSDSERGTRRIVEAARLERAREHLAATARDEPLLAEGDKRALATVQTGEPRRRRAGPAAGGWLRGNFRRLFGFE